MGENRNGAEDEIRRDSVKSVSSGEGDRLLQDDVGDVSTTTGKSEGWGVPQSPSDDVDDDGYYYRYMLTMNQEKKIIMIVMYGAQSVNSINMNLISSHGIYLPLYILLSYSFNTNDIHPC
jgi:hypothetical protein